MGVELLIDAELARDPRFASGYAAGLRCGAGPEAGLGCLSFAARSKLRLLCAHLLKKGVGLHTRDDQRFRSRIGAALEGRRRLQPSAEELATIANHLAHERDVAPDVPHLLLELEPLFAGESKG